MPVCCSPAQTDWSSSKSASVCLCVGLSVCVYMRVLKPHKPNGSASCAVWPVHRQCDLCWIRILYSCCSVYCSPLYLSLSLFLFSPLLVLFPTSTSLPHGFDGSGQCWWHCPCNKQWFKRVVLFSLSLFLAGSCRPRVAGACSHRGQTEAANE